VADLLADSAPVTLSGHVNKLDFDSMAGEWVLDVTVKSSNGGTRDKQWEPAPPGWYRGVE
jgi:hypothetical protein